MRLTRKQQQTILAAMFEEAQCRNAEGLSIKEVVRHVGQVRDDLRSAYSQGVTLLLIPDLEQQGK